MLNKVVPFHVSHMEIVDIEDSVQKNYSELLKNPFVKILTLIINGRVNAFIGVNQIDSGVGLIWVRRIEKNKHTFMFCKIVKKLIPELLGKAMGLHKIQMTIKTNDPKLERWAAFLDFTHEGQLSAYGADKSDYFIYGRSL